MLINILPGAGVREPRARGMVITLSMRGAKSRKGGLSVLPGSRYFSVSSSVSSHPRRLSGGGMVITLSMRGYFSVSLSVSSHPRRLSGGMAITLSMRA